MNPNQAAELRRSVRDYLAQRPSVSQAPATIHRFMGRDFPASAEDVGQACVILTTFGQVTETTDPMGGPVKYYRITAQGILDHEAGR